jgi:hypothetical protein
MELNVNGAKQGGWVCLNGDESREVCDCYLWEANFSQLGGGGGGVLMRYCPQTLPTPQ